MDDDALNALWKGDPFSIKKELKDLLFAAIPSAFTPEELKSTSFPLCLTERQVFAIRWHIFSFLNAVEIVFQAWHSDVADREIIFRQMSPLYSPKNRRTFMQRFRDIADGKESWPALHAFIASITPLAEKPKSVDEASRG